MTRRWLLSTWMTLAMGAAGAGCGGAEVTTGDDEPTDEAKDGLAERGDAEPPGPRMHGPMGAAEAIVHAALSDEIGLSDAKREQLKTKLDAARPKPPVDHAALVAAVRSGKVGDLEEVDMEKARAEHDKAIGSVLDELHGLLSKAQRARVVAMVKDRKDGPPHGPPEGARDDDRERGPRGERPHRGGPPGIDHLLHGVTLKDGQREKIEEALAAAGIAPPEGPPPREAMEKHRAAQTALLEAFAADDFDAAAAMPKDTPRPKPPSFVKVLGIVVPLLTAEQREQLATNLEHGPPMGPPAP